MPPTIPAVEPDTVAATFPRRRLAADDHIPASASTIKAARHADAEPPRRCAARQAP
jgi:hypothetical protein